MNATTHDGAASERQGAWNAQTAEWKARSDAIVAISGIYPVTRTDGNRQPIGRIWVALDGTPAGISWQDGIARQNEAAMLAVPGNKHYDSFLEMHSRRMAVSA